MGRQITNAILVIVGAAILLFGGTTILGMIGFLPQEFADTVLGAVVQIVSSIGL